MTKRQHAALKRYADQLDRRAEQALKQYETLRAQFPEYVTADGGLVMTAATACDHATTDAAAFRQRLQTQGLQEESS